MYRARYKEYGVQKGLQTAYDQIKITMDDLISNGEYDSDDPRIKGMADSLDVVLDAARLEGVNIVRGHVDAPKLYINDIKY